MANPRRKKLRSKRWLKRFASKIARRRGYKKVIHGWGGFIGGVVADMD